MHCAINLSTKYSGEKTQYLWNKHIITALKMLCTIIIHWLIMYQKTHFFNFLILYAARDWKLDARVCSEVISIIWTSNHSRRFNIMQYFQSYKAHHPTTKKTVGIWLLIKWLPRLMFGRESLILNLFAILWD